MVLYERDALLALSLEVPVALSKVCACCAGWREYVYVYVYVYACVFVYMYMYLYMYMNMYM